MKVALVFASMTGNTEEITEIIAEKLKKLDVSYNLFQIDLDDLMADDLMDYQAILFGTYTWGDGDLPYEIEDFYEDLEDVDLTGRIVGLFGSCDSFYPNYGTALDMMSERFQQIGAKVVLDPLKVDLSPDQDDVLRCERFAEQFVKHIAKEEK